VGIYRLTSGRFRRFEEGRLTEYKVGDLVDLNAHEARRLRRLIKHVGRAPQVPEPCPEATEAGEAILDRLSGPVTPEPEGVTQDKGVAEMGGDDPTSGDGGPDSDTVGGTALFSPGETPERTVTELRTVVANIGEPSVLSDMMDAEATSKKPRRTVFTLLESRHRQLVEAEEEG